MDTKKCRKCEVEKPLEEFTITDRHYGYRKSRCKSCENKRIYDYYHTNEQYQEKAKLRARGLIPKKPEVIFDEETQKKICTRCNLELFLSMFSRMKSGKFGRMSRCSECIKSLSKNAIKEGRWPSSTVEGQRNYRLSRNYGISNEIYESLLANQNGVCALCRSDDHRSNGRSKHFVVDHDHSTSKVRGLLCSTCNIWLGNYEALLERSGKDGIDRYLSFSPYNRMMDEIEKLELKKSSHI